MPRIIDFKDYNPSDDRKMFLINKTIKEADDPTLSVPIKQRDNIPGTIELLNQIYPGKILFNIKVSEITNLSYEFIRRKIAIGIIKSIPFGDRRMISITELSFILNNGVNNGSTTIN